MTNVTKCDKWWQNVTKHKKYDKCDKMLKIAKHGKSDIMWKNMTMWQNMKNVTKFDKTWHKVTKYDKCDNHEKAWQKCNKWVKMSIVRQHMTKHDNCDKTWQVWQNVTSVRKYDKRDKI